MLADEEASTINKSATPGSKSHGETSLNALPKTVETSESAKEPSQGTSLGFDSAAKSSTSISFGNPSGHGTSALQLPVFRPTMGSEATSSGIAIPSTGGGLLGWNAGASRAGFSEDAPESAASARSLFAGTGSSSKGSGTQAGFGSSIFGFSGSQSTNGSPTNNTFGASRKGAASQPLFGATAASSSSLTASGGLSGLFGTTSTTTSYLFGGANGSGASQSEIDKYPGSSSTLFGGASSAAAGFGRFGAVTDSAASSSGLLFGGSTGLFGSSAPQSDGQAPGASRVPWKPSGGTFAGLATVEEDNAGGVDAGALFYSGLALLRPRTTFPRVTTLLVICARGVLSVQDYTSSCLCSASIRNAVQCILSNHCFQPFQ
jgi:hypothetical protein